MNVESIAILVDVLEYRSFSAAARTRGVTATAIARAIKALEASVGVRLLERDTGRPIATAKGALFVDHVKPLIAQLERADRLVRDCSSAAKGLISVAAPVAFGQLAIVPLLPEFERLWPELSIDLRLDDAPTDLLPAHSDLALKLGELPDSEFMATRVCSLQYVVCASPAYLRAHARPAKPSDLTDRECLLSQHAAFSGAWSFHDGASAIEVPVTGKLTSPDVLALMECCSAGMGIAMLPRLAVASRVRDGQLIDLFPSYDVSADGLERTVWLVYHQRSHLPRKVIVLIDFLKDRLAEIARRESARSVADLVPACKPSPTMRARPAVASFCAPRLLPLAGQL